MKAIQIPFDKNGMQQYPLTWADDFRWVDNYTFKAKLKLTGYSRGRSAAGFTFEDSKGQHYYMFMKDMEELLMTSVIDRGSVSGTWTFVKRGQNYGLQKVKPTLKGTMYDPDSGPGWV